MRKFTFINFDMIFTSIKLYGISLLWPLSGTDFLTLVCSIFTAQSIFDQYNIKDDTLGPPNAAIKLFVMIMQKHSLTSLGWIITRFSSSLFHYLMIWNSLDIVIVMYLMYAEQALHIGPNSYLILSCSYQVQLL